MILTLYLSITNVEQLKSLLYLLQNHYFIEVDYKLGNTVYKTLSKIFAVRSQVAKIA